MRSIAYLLLALSALMATSAKAQVTPADEAVSMHPDDLVWQDGPSGRTLAVLFGDLESENPFVIRVKFPAGDRIARHYHPTMEFGTVLSGTMFLSVGDETGMSEPMEYRAGSFFAVPAGMHISGWVEEETIVQVHGQGPFESIPVEEERSRY